HALDHPQTHDVFEVPVGAAVAALVGKVGGAAFGRRDGGAVFDAQQTPGAAGKRDGIFVPRGHRQVSRAGVVGGGQDHRAAKAALGLHGGRQAAQHAARHADGLEDAPRQAQFGDEFVVPVAAGGPHQRGGGGVGVLVGGDAGQLVV